MFWNIVGAGMLIGGVAGAFFFEGPLFWSRVGIAVVGIVLALIFQRVGDRILGYLRAPYREPRVVRSVCTGGVFWTPPGAARGLKTRSAGQSCQLCWLMVEEGVRHKHCREPEIAQQRWRDMPVPVRPSPARPRGGAAHARVQGHDLCG